VAEFVSALERVAAGGTALDPEVISQLLRKPDPGLASLTSRERNVIGLMAEGRSNSGIAGKLVLSESAVEKHVASIFGKLSSNRRPQTTAASSPCSATSVRDTAACLWTLPAPS
jgi:DNA-binding NarL/FixJ family response regulator